MEFLQLPLGPLPAALAISCVLLGALVQGASGFGMAMIAAPLLALIDPRFVPGPIIAASIVISPLVARRDRAHIDFVGLKYALAGSAVGTVLAAAILLYVSKEGLSLLFAAVVLIGVAVSASGWHVAPSRKNNVLAGVLAGVMGTTASINGPPLALLYQNQRGQQMRGTLAGYFLVAAVLALVALRAVGRYGLVEVQFSLLLAPGVLLGFLASGRLARILDRGHTRKAVLIISAAAAVSVIVKQLLQW